MKTKKIIALALSVLCIALSVPFTALASDAVPAGKTVLEYDFSQMTDLSGVKLDSFAFSPLVASECTLEGGRLVVANNATKQSVVNLFDYKPAMQAGSVYTVTLKASFNKDNAASTSTDEHRFGIAYNLNPTDLDYSYAMIRENGKTSIGSYRNYSWLGNSSGDVSYSAGYTAGTEYTITLEAKADETITLSIADSTGTLITNTKTNARCGEGLGIYVRGCEAEVSYFSVVEYKAITPQPIVTGTKVLEQDFENVTDVSQIEGFSKIFDAGSSVYTVEDGRMKIAANSSYSVAKLFDYTSATGAYTIVLKGSMTADAAQFRTSTTKTQENKYLLGVAFNIDSETNSYNAALMRTTGCTEMSYFVGNAWKKSTAGTNIENVMNYSPSEEFEITVKVYADGTVRMAYNGYLTTLEWDAQDGNGIGIIARNSEVYVDSLTVYEDAVNSTKYVGTQVSEITSDSTYSVRFVANIDSTVGKTAGFKVNIAYGNSSAEVDLVCTSVYRKVNASANNGITESYSSVLFGGNYLIANGISDIPVSAGEVTFTVTPYYTLAGKTYASQSYTVVYNAGTLVSQTAVS